MRETDTLRETDRHTHIHIHVSASTGEIAQLVMKSLMDKHRIQALR